MAVSEAIRGQLEGASWIRKMFEEGIRLSAEHGAENVFDLSLGNPLLEPPHEFKDRLLELVRDDTPNTHRYMPNSGFPKYAPPLQKAWPGSLVLPWRPATSS